MRVPVPTKFIPGHPLLRLVALAATVVVGSAFAGATPATASTTSVTTLVGSVRSVGDTSFTILSSGRTLTIHTTAATRYREPSVRSASFADLHIGHTVGVRGRPVNGSPNTYLAFRVVLSAPTGAALPELRSADSAAGLSVTGTVSDIGADGFTLTDGAASIRVKVGSGTSYFENGAAAPGLASLTDGMVVAVAGSADSTSNHTVLLLDAVAVYLKPSTAPPSTTSTTSGTSAPSPTAAGELPPGGVPSNITSRRFTYTNGSTTVTVVIEPYTVFYLGDHQATIVALSDAGVTVGTSGTADPSSTSSARIVDAIHVYLTAPGTTTTEPPVTTTTPSGTSTPSPTSAGELPPGGVPSNITSSGFTYTNGPTTVTVVIAPYTLFYLGGHLVTIAALSDAGVTVGTSGTVDPSSTSSARIVDAIHVYLTAPGSTTTTTEPPVTTTTTTPSGTSTPSPTAAGELPPGGVPSNITSSGFTYTNGPTTVTVVIEPYTLFYLGGHLVTIAALSDAGVTVGTSGTADPSSTSSARIVDAIHVYLTE